MIMRTKYFLMALGIAAFLAGCSSSDDNGSADLQRQLDMRADISPDHLADLRAQIETLMGRADISPADLADLRAQVEELMGRADISPGDLVELQGELEKFRMAQMMVEQREQERRDAQIMAGLEGGLAQSPQPPVYAASDRDTLSNLLPDGDAVFSPLSSAIRLHFPGTNHGVMQSDLGAAYVKSVSSDGEGGFRVSYVLDGEETLVHFAADQYRPDPWFDFMNLMEDAGFWLWSWTDSFGDANDTDRTDGSTVFNYFDFHGWAYDGAGEGRRGSLAYGARTMPDNLPMGNATYAGYAITEWWNADNAYWGTQRYLQGHLMLEASLDDMEISGRIDGFRIPGWWSDSGEDEPLDASNSIAIASTAIDQARFNATWIGNGPMDVASNETFYGATGTILGEFYGPAAAEVGGVLSGSRPAMGSSPGQVIVGGFGAAQLSPAQ